MCGGEIFYTALGLRFHQNLKPRWVLSHTGHVSGARGPHVADGRRGGRHLGHDGAENTS